MSDNIEYGKWIIETVIEGRWTRVEFSGSWFSEEQAGQAALEYAVVKPGLHWGINIRARQLGFDPCGSPVGKMS